MTTATPSRAAGLAGQVDDASAAGEHAETAAKLVCVTDIPTPYRLHQFKFLCKELQSRGIDFEVLFMAPTVSIRYWKFDSGSFEFPYRICSGIHPEYKGGAYHFNPGLLWRVWRRPPTWLLLAGEWRIPTAIGLALAAPLFRAQTCTVMWAEANRHSMRYKTGPIAVLRRLYMRGAQAFAVPGKIAEETLVQVCGVRTARFLRWPNLVDERIFGNRVSELRLQRREVRQKWNLQATDRVLLWPARLHESSKGILNFLQAVGPQSLEKVRILLAGDGPDRKLIEGWLASNGNQSIQLLGQQSQEDMLELYAAADVLLMPSFRDPNPLSVIEALWAGLPLLVSSHCGNWPEAVQTGRNGWVVDPHLPDSMRSAFEHLLSASSAELEEYGSVSKMHAQDCFSTLPTVRAFVDELLALRTKS